jgi:ribosomal protein L37AE/L43A
MRDDLMAGLPGDLPVFLERFGSDAKCRAYLVRTRWPEGFRCEGCGHDRAYRHKKRLIEECRACGKQHSLLAGPSSSRPRPGSRGGSSRSTW